MAEHNHGATSEDLPALARVLNHCQGLIEEMKEKRDMVEYGLALAMAARSVHRTVKRSGGPDAERYEHLGKILHELGDDGKA